MIAVLVVLAVIAVTGCAKAGGDSAFSWLPLPRSGKGDADVPATPVDHAVRGLLFVGFAMLFIGGLVLAARLMGHPTAPFIGGIWTMGAGVGVLVLADLLAKFWQLVLVLLLILVIFLLIEWYNDRWLLFRKPPEDTNG